MLADKFILVCASLCRNENECKTPAPTRTLAAEEINLLKQLAEANAASEIGATSSAIEVLVSEMNKQELKDSVRVACEEHKLPRAYIKLLFLYSFHP